MNVETFLAEFGHLADAPNGISKLRDLILELAFRGKLVRQSSDENSIEFALSRADAERERLLSQKAISRKYVEPVTTSDEWFQIPKRWKWTRLARIAHDWGQKKPTSEFTYIDVASIDNRRGRVSDSPQIVKASQASPRARKLVRRGSVIFSTVRPYLLNSAIIESEYTPTPIVSTAFGVLHPFDCVNERFLHLYLRSSPFVAYVRETMIGVAYPAIDDKTLWSGLIPIPPLAEQQRIVAKVDELMALCDELEAKQSRRQTVRVEATTAALSRLTTATTPAALSTTWTRVADHFDDLFTTPKSIPQLRQTILQLAVMGKLVPQDAEDEPAGVTVSKVALKKERTSSKKTGRDWNGELDGTIPEAFQIPDGWTWTRIGNAVERVTVGYVGSMKNEYVEDGIPFLRSQNVRANRFRPEGLIRISREFHQKIKKSSLSPGDVVVVRSGNVGTACVIPAELTDANCSDLVVIKKPLATTPQFLCFYLNSAAAVHVESGRVGVALTHFNTKSVATMPLPLPPLAEQHRIVAKVDELMAICDSLETKLATEQMTAERLTAAMVQAVLNA